MKKGWNPMTVAVSVVIALLIAVPAVGWLFGRTGDFGNANVAIGYKNAPEGTAYADILVKSDSIDFVEFNALQNPPKKLVNIEEVTGVVVDESGNTSTRVDQYYEYEDIKITKDSEIARYNDGGFVGLSLHYGNCAGFKYYESGRAYILIDREKSDEGFRELEKNGGYKAAYVDEHGKVLSVTDICEIDYRPFKPYEFSLNGSAFTYHVYESTPQSVLLCKIAIIGFPLSLVGLIVCSVLAFRAVCKRKSPLPNPDVRQKK